MALVEKEVLEDRYGKIAKSLNNEFDMVYIDLTLNIIIIIEIKHAEFEGFLKMKEYRKQIEKQIKRTSIIKDICKDILNCDDIPIYNIILTNNKERGLKIDETKKVFGLNIEDDEQNFIRYWNEIVENIHKNNVTNDKIKTDILD